jgi:putative SOS response-associated peptidase YedK
MCGRFTQAYTWEQIHAFSQPLTNELPLGGGNLQPRYNIAPTTDIQIIVRTATGRALRMARWGLVPRWWKKPLKGMPATFNARVETVDSAAMFRDAYRQHRCIIPASGFFEWTGPKEERTPHYFTAADGELLAFAGLWERWTNPETGVEIATCTIIVREADAWTARYHDRMPTMLHPKDFDAWLDGTAGKELLQAPPRPLREWIVSQRMNSSRVGDDDPATIAPA